MSGGGWGLVVAVVLGLVTGEFSELSPWLAQKLIRWAARVRYPTRVEELSALIAERPGKLFKLVTASGFACAALTYRVTHRKTDPVRSVTNRFWIGLGSALVAGVLLTGGTILAIAVDHRISDFGELSSVWSILLGAITAFATAAEFLILSRLSAGWATAVVSFALLLIGHIVLGLWWPDVQYLTYYGGTAVAAGVSATCAIRSGNRLRFPVISALSTILGSSLPAFAMIFITWWPIRNGSEYVSGLVVALCYGFALGFSVGVGVLLSRVLCGGRQYQSSSQRVPPSAT